MDSFQILVVAEPNAGTIFDFFVLLDYVSRAHEIEIYCMDVFQILFVASSGPYAQTIFFFFVFFLVFFFFSFFLFIFYE